MNSAMTGAEAGLSGERQILIALQKMVENNGSASISEIYEAVEKEMSGNHLDDQGKASLRRFINTVAVRAGFVYPSNPETRGKWYVTPEGRERVLPNDVPKQEATEEAINVDTQKSVQVPSNSIRGTAFELYILDLLKAIHPFHTWYHQGQRKNNERGIDFIGSLIGNLQGQPQFIGVQVKFHAANTAPSQIEWLKFLAGCFSRRVDHAIFVTTGRLTSEQRREAGEARIVVIEGRNELTRISKHYSISEFDLFEEDAI